MKWIRTLWQHLRHWSGDDAYERYLAEHHEHSHELLSRREFYRQYFERQGKKARCC